MGAVAPVGEGPRPSWNPREGEGPIPMDRNRTGGQSPHNNNSGQGKARSPTVPVVQYLRPGDLSFNARKKSYKNLFTKSKKTLLARCEKRILLARCDEAKKSKQ